MGEGYIGAVLRFAFKGAILRTDQLSIVAAVSVPAIFHTSGSPMPEWAGSYASLAILILVGAGVGLRLVTAPYFLWRGQNTVIADLKRQLDSPRHLERQHLAKILAEERQHVADEVSRIRTFALRGKGTEEEIFQTFYGTEKHIDKFWHDEEFQRRWVVFEREVKNFIQTSHGLNDAEKKLFRDFNQSFLNNAAKLVIDYILYEYAALFINHTKGGGEAGR